MKRFIAVVLMVLLANSVAAKESPSALRNFCRADAALMVQQAESLLNIDIVLHYDCDGPLNYNLICDLAKRRADLFLPTQDLETLETRDELAFLIFHEAGHAWHDWQCHCDPRDTKSRHELEFHADRFAVKAMRIFGYNPRAAIAVLARWGDQASLTHPSCRDRIRAIQTILARPQQYDLPCP